MIERFRATVKYSFDPVYKHSMLPHTERMNEAREQGELLAAALAEVVEQARWEAKIRSPHDLAIRAGMTHTALYKRLSGEVKINARDLGALAYALGVSPAELVERAQEVVASNSVWSAGPALDIAEDQPDERTLGRRSPRQAEPRE